MLTSTVSATDNLFLDSGGAYVTISSSPNPSLPGQDVTFTFHVDLLYYDESGGRYILPAPGGKVYLCNPGGTTRISDEVQVHDGMATIITNCFSDGEENNPMFAPGTAPGTYNILVEYDWYSNDDGAAIQDDRHGITQTVVAKNNIPEFPSVAIPVAASLGLLLIFCRKKSD